MPKSRSPSAELSASRAPSREWFAASASKQVRYRIGGQSASHRGRRLQSDPPSLSMSLFPQWEPRHRSGTRTGGSPGVPLLQRREEQR